MNLLDLATEIRLQILCHLLANRTIKVEAELIGDPLEDAVWVMKHSGCLYPAVLCVCLQLFSEGQSLIYTDNVFDCSQREGTNLLLKCIGSGNLVQIKHLVLEWDQLQDLSWALAKEPGGSYFAGLESVLMATWRTRILGGKSLVWQQNKNYERQLCNAAINILEKHPKLISLLQISYKKGNMSSVHSNNNHRVKWRFIAAEQKIRAGETIVNLEGEIEKLRVKIGEDSGEPVQKMIDSF